MTTEIQNGSELNDPVGSIFLPEHKLTQQFLQFEGDPIDILADLYDVNPDCIEAVYGKLTSKLFLLRGLGVELALDDDITDEECELYARMDQFYRAIRIALGNPVR